MKYFCGNNVVSGVYIDGVKVIHPNEIVSLKKNYDIYISSNNIVDEAMR